MLGPKLASIAITNFKGIDHIASLDLTDGEHPNQFCVISALEGGGKSSFLLALYRLLHKCEDERYRSIPFFDAGDHRKEKETRVAGELRVYGKRVKPKVVTRTVTSEEMSSDTVRANVLFFSTKYNCIRRICFGR